MTARADPAGGLLGRSIRCYVIESELGRGGMGVVYLARDTLLDREVAVKVLPDEFVRDPDMLARFRQEAKLLASLNHPNIATVHGLEEMGDRGRALVLERVEGETLARRLRRGRLSLEEALAICAQVARALEAAHEQGVVHRDLKPGNVMVGPRGQVKVLDFGLARRAAGPALPVMEAALPSGTPGYMSPEQIRLEPEDQRTDIFAFGCILFECITGRRAFDGPTPQERTRQNLEGEPDWRAWPADAAEPIRGEVAGCLERNPDRRRHRIGAVLQALEAAHRGGAAVPIAPPPRVRGLPWPQTTFVGRERELRDIERTLASARLLTLSGPGGCGKTRLALEAARRSAPTFPGGTWFVDLAPISDSDRVAPAVLSVLGPRDTPGLEPADRLIAQIGDARALLLLDNCEHLLSGCARLADSLIRSCAGLKILATSREAFAIAGEREMVVSPLSVPDPGVSKSAEATGSSESVRLFLDRAAVVQPGFSLTETNATDVAKICLRLEGIPLAIELAAARVKVLSPAQILARLADRFGLLTEDRTGESRHRTLRAAVQSSYDHLAESERAILRALSVFVGGWTLEAAEALRGEPSGGFETLDGLTRLVNKSLVSVERRAGGDVRYRMLETIREFARAEMEKAGEEPVLRARHLEYFTSLVRTAEAELVRRDQAVWLERLQSDLENILAAFDWSEHAEGRIEAGLEIASGLYRFWMRQGHPKLGMSLLERALARPGGSAPSPGRARALCAAAIMATVVEDERRAAFIEESLAMARALGDRREIARALNVKGVSAIGRDDLTAAREYLEEALRYSREVEAPHLEGMVLQNLAVTVSRQGDDATAWALAVKSIEIHRAFGDRGSEGIGYLISANYALRGGRGPEARPLLLDALRTFREVGDKRNVAAALRLLGPVAADAGAPRVAVRLTAAGVSVRESIGIGMNAGDQREQDAVMDRVRAAIGEPALAEEWGRGRALGYEEALDGAIDFLSSDATVSPRSPSTSPTPGSPP